MKKMLVALMTLMLCLVLAGCSDSDDTASTENLTCAQIAEIAEKAADFMPLTEAPDKYIEKYLLIDAEAELDDWDLRRDASRATPEMILVLKVKPEADQAFIKQAVQDFHDDQIMAYRDYQPEQMPKLESAKVLENGPFIALIVSPDATKVNAALGKGWK